MLFVTALKRMKWQASKSEKKNFERISVRRSRTSDESSTHNTLSRSFRTYISLICMTCMI